ncbi:hypothetical protein HY967_03125 [Candidatus Jorgensenbacteria bacterium]|nr:hypothetical protein [Candidatus Jorgensenbacteria bacterium]
MDYTSDPDGPPSNEHPNAHDYEQLETIYAHLDSTTTVGQTISRGGNAADALDEAEWGAPLKHDGKGRNSLYVRDLGHGEKVFTFVFWAK